MKKIISMMLLLTIMCGAMLAIPNEVQASESDKGLVVDGSELTDAEESSSVVYAYLASTLRGVYLLEGAAAITKPFTGIVGCAGSTTANFAVSAVGVGVTLQQYVNGSWVYVNGWTATNTNSYYVSIYKTQSVTSGYYYRVKTSHIAASESTITATSGIYIT